MKKTLILLSLIFVLNSCNEGEKQKENVGVNSGSITNTGNVEVSKKDENLAIESSGSIINSGSLEEEKVSSGSVASEEKTNSGIVTSEEKTNSGSFKEVEFYGIDFNLSYNDKKYELIGENVGNDVEYIEILSCKENNSKMYDENWYKLETFKKGDKNFKYFVSEELNNYCNSTYKIRLNGDDAKVVELDLNLEFVNEMEKSIKNSFHLGNFNIESKINTINLNTLKFLNIRDKNYFGIDKNNLYLLYSQYPGALSIFNIENYKTFKYNNGIIYGDNFIYNPLIGKKGIGIDGKTFENIKNNYYKDKNNYYQSRNIDELFLIGNIKNNFEILSNEVYKYNNKIYFYDKEIKDVDFKTFLLQQKNISNGGNYGIYIFAYEKDKLYFANDYGGYGLNSFLKSLYGDFETLKHIYSGNKFGSDGKTFHIDILVDKNYLFYYKDNEIKQIKYSFNLETIKYDETLGLLVDKNGKYDFKDNKISKVK